MSSELLDVLDVKAPRLRLIRMITDMFTTLGILWYLCGPV